MGAQQSVPAIHGRIDNVLPHHTFELARSNDERAKLVKHVVPIFPGGHHDRTQFVHALRVLLSSNGQVPLGDKHFKLVFSRTPEEFVVANEDDNAQIFVSIVATSTEGVLAAKITSERAGRDNVEAFAMFRKTVEMHMHKMLDNVPGPGQQAGPSTSTPMFDSERNQSAASLTSTVLPDEPPTYQEANK